MRRPIRYQLLVPLLTLLAGVAGVSTWTALASADRARTQIVGRMRDVAETLVESGNIPVTKPRVLEQMKGFSQADYLLVAGDGTRVTTLPTDAAELPPADVVVDKW
ncbi:MAG TPA: hypothetical protein VFW33_09920, partial [Gemmataceae bacterium]|nr:hypothetical protein [Gemmataceae bacterium]